MHALFLCLQDCVSAVCRWLSAYGWSDGIKCITLPSDLRRRVGNGKCLYSKGPTRVPKVNSCLVVLVLKHRKLY